MSYDLHIHSCLSPCGDEDMTPANIVGMAALKNLEVIAVTDHNSCKNCPAVLTLAEEQGIVAIPGMELCTAEEVHVLCLFESLDDALRFDGFVAEKLLKILNREEIFGKQEIVDAEDRRIGIESYLLVNATEISFDHLDLLMQEYHGIYIPAHIDKTSNGLISNLGFIPPESKFRCVEVKNSEKAVELKEKHPYLSQCNIITNSDAHTLGLIHEPEHFLCSESRDRKDIIKALMDVWKT
ncbi:MAG: putative metal-dependent phosphoesterase family [Herbinix sp.]|jgi:PHP family Zn ribbon phosphoesterase|nr:putative metal-dependent phosphoesterase family [Herbinix sp.]